MLRGMVNRGVTGIVGSALALTSAILLTADSSPRPGGVSLTEVLGRIGLFVSVLILLTLVVQILREHD